MITILITPTFAITSTKPSLAHANSLQLLSRSWRVFFCCLASTCHPVTTSESYQRCPTISSEKAAISWLFDESQGPNSLDPGENVEMEKLAVSWMILAAWFHCYHPFETSARSKLEYVVWSCKLEWNLEIMFESRHLSDVCYSLLSIHWWRNTYIAGRISMTIWAVFFTLEKKQNPLPLILAIYK